MALSPSRNDIKVRRVISVGQDRKTGEAIIRGEGPLGRDITIRIHPTQLQTLAVGVIGLAKSRETPAGE